MDIFPRKYRPLLYSLITLAVCALGLFIGAKSTSEKALTHEFKNLLLQSEVSAYSTSLAMAEQSEVLQIVMRNPKLTNSLESDHHKIEILQVYAQGSDLVRVGVADLEGNVLTSDNLELNVANQQWFKRALNGNKTYHKYDGSSADFGDPLFVMGGPLYKNGKVIGAAFAVQNVAHYVRGVYQSVTLEGPSVYFLDGQYEFIDTANDDFKQAIREQSLLDDKGNPTTFKETIARNMDGSAQLRAEEDSYLLSIKQIEGGSNWSILSVSSKSSTLFRQFQTVRFFVYISAAAVVLLSLLVYLLTSVRIHDSNVSASVKRLESQGLNIDAWTGLRDRKGVFSVIEEARPSLGSNEIAFLGLVSVSTFKELATAIDSDFADVVRAVSAERLKQMENEQLIVGLYSPDTYLVYASGFKTRRDAIGLARIFKTKIDEPVRHGELLINLNSKMGIRLFFIGERSANDLDYLINCAETALEFTQADETSRADLALPLNGFDEGNQDFYVFDSSTQEEIQKRRAIESDISKALKRNELRLLFQPIVDLHTGELHSVEVLLRWLHPGWGLLSPKDFLPIAEKQGRMIEIGSWVVQEALKSAAAFVERGTLISINVSSGELLNPDYISFLCDVAERYHLKDGRIMIECPSQVVMSGNPQMLEVIGLLEACGILICIDDFNFCMQEMDYIHSLKLRAIKLEIDDIGSLSYNENRRSNLQAVIASAKAQSISVVVKNVSSEKDLDTYKNLGIEFGQGHAIARPNTPQEILREFSSNGLHLIKDKREDNA